MDELVVVPDKKERRSDSPMLGETGLVSLRREYIEQLSMEESVSAIVPRVDGRQKGVRIESFGMKLSTRRMPSLSEAELNERLIICEEDIFSAKCK